MEILDMLLGRDKKKSDGFLEGLLRSFGKWVVGCGCLAIAGLVAALAFLLATVGNQALSVILVVATIVVAIASLIRTSLGY
jgi:hypothetical protein